MIQTDFFQKLEPNEGTNIKKTKGFEVLPNVVMNFGRVHQILGDARHEAASKIAKNCCETVLWITPDWMKETRPDFKGATNINCISPHRSEDILACTEMGLQQRSATLVIVDLPGQPAISSMRRLQLAAANHLDVERFPSICIILTPETRRPVGIKSAWIADENGLRPHEHLMRDHLKSRRLLAH